MTTTATKTISGKDLRRLRTAGLELTERAPEPGYIGDRREQCVACDEFYDGYCEQVIDDKAVGSKGCSKKCKLRRQMLKFLRDPDTECPIGRWHTQRITDA